MAENEEKIWTIFLRRHWKMFSLFVTGAVLAIIGAVLVFLWFVGQAQCSGLVPTILEFWTMGHLVSFILHLIFWEILIIVIPVAVALIFVWRFWWKNLPEDERQEYRRRHLFGKRSKWADGGGGFSLFINILFVIKVYLDGNWDKPFAKYTFDYLVYSYLTIFILLAIIVGIPMAIGAIWWIRNQIGKAA